MDNKKTICRVCRKTEYKLFDCGEGLWRCFNCVGLADKRKFKREHKVVYSRKKASVAWMMGLQRR